MKRRDWHLRPILSAMRHNKVGALLICAQMALTLAFVSNAFTLVEHRIAWTSRPSGVDEGSVFVVSTDSLADHADGGARVAADLSALRGIAGVSDAYLTNDWPFAGGGWSQSVHVKPNQTFDSGSTSYYFGDTHTLATLGLRLVAGRNFTSDEVIHKDRGESPHVNAVIITRSLAETLFPSGSALGQSLYIEDDLHPVRVVGIVERLQGPFPSATGSSSRSIENSTIAPYVDVRGDGNYLVRADPDRLAASMRAAEERLGSLDPERTVHVESLLEARAKAHRGDQGLVVLLVAICAALLTVTAFGIIGLTSYWVSQRRQQIGIRRALGATRHDIVQHFQTENLVIATGGAISGILFALGLNLWMVQSFEMTRMESSRAIVGALVILALGQAAVFWPALKASLVPPALATRGG